LPLQSDIDGKDASDDRAGDVGKGVFERIGSGLHIVLDGLIIPERNNFIATSDDNGSNGRR
jgi:hypothetical protein